jgi:hypothetical protein
MERRTFGRLVIRRIEAVVLSSCDVFVDFLF